MSAVARPEFPTHAAAREHAADNHECMVTTTTGFGSYNGLTGASHCSDTATHLVTLYRGSAPLLMCAHHAMIERMGFDADIAELA